MASSRFDALDVDVMALGTPLPGALWRWMFGTLGFHDFFCVALFIALSSYDACAWSRSICVGDRGSRI